MRKIEKLAKVGMWKVMVARDRIWISLPSILFMACVFFLFISSWQEPTVMEVLEEFVHLRFKPSKDWYNLLVEPSSNYTSTLVQAIYESSTTSSPCSMATTNSTVLEGLPAAVEGKYIFLTDTVQYITLVAYDSEGKRRCAGGDYYEVDFHDKGDFHFRSRLPTVDYGNGSYGLELIVPSRYAGTYNLEIYLLFSNWHGMDFQPKEFVKQVVVVQEELEMVVPSSSKRQKHFRWSVLDATAAKQKPLKQMQQCAPSDFDRTTWQGRWSRNWSRLGCEADGEKRYHCLPPDHYQCEEPYCFGPVGRLESNGWVYSAHCGFKIWTAEEAWKCLDGRWFLMWGDSNFQDTIRNLLLFVLDWNLPPGQSISDFTLARTYEAGFINPNRLDQMLRVSQIFNGAYPDYDDGEGLETLRNEEHQKLVLSHFGGTRWPDTIFMNSGLHDGEQFQTIEAYIESVDFAVEWWAKLYESIPEGRKPTLVWRTTIAPAGVARGMQSNPNKMEMYNQVMVEKLKQAGERLPVMFVDGFDLTFPFHYNNDYSDGGHYGRAPGANVKPWFGAPHWYFVDVMVAHIFLNAVCPTS